MITFKQIFKQVFSSDGLNLNTISDALQNTILSQTNNTIAAASNVYETFLHQAESYALSSNVMNAFDEIADGVKTTIDQQSIAIQGVLDMLRPKDFIGEFNVISFFASSLVNSTQQIGQIDGQPVKLIIQRYSSGAGKDPAVGFSVQVGNAPKGFIGFLFEDGRFQANYDGINIPMNINADGQIATAYNSLQSIISQLEDGADNANCVLDMISATFANGTIPKSVLNSVLENYSGCSFASQAKDMLAKYDSFSSANILSIISTCMKKVIRSKHNDEDDYYTPNADAGYVTNMLSTVTNLLVDVVATVLAAVFHKFAVVIGVIWTVIKNVFSKFMDNIDATSPKVSRYSILPIWNIYGGNSTNFNPISMPNLESLVLPFINDMGTAFIKHRDSSLATGFWLAPTGDDHSYVLQQVFTGWMGEWGVRAPRATITVVTKAGSLFESCTVKIDDHGDSLYPGTYLTVSQDDSYLTATDDQLRLSLWDAVSEVLYRAIIPGELVTWTNGSREWMYDKNGGSLNYTDLLYNLNEDNTLNVRQKAAILLGLMEGSSGYNVAFNHDRAASWTDLNTIIKSEVYRQASIAFLVSSHGSLADSSILYPGRDCSDPCIIFPTISVNAVLGAALTAAVTGAAIGVTTLVIKSKRKKKAINNLALKEAQFEKASAAYKKTPTPANAKELGKANRKLTRAWNRAGRAGVKSYNGFGTGAETGQISSETSSVVDEFFTTMNSADTIVSSTEQNSSSNDLMSSSYENIVKLLKS